MGKLLQDTSIGQNIKQLRKGQGYTQAQLIAKMHLLGSEMSRTTLIKIEGGYRNIFISDLIILKTIFNVSYDSFFEGLAVKGRSE